MPKSATALAAGQDIQSLWSMYREQVLLAGRLAPDCDGEAFEAACAAATAALPEILSHGIPGGGGFDAIAAKALVGLRYAEFWFDGDCEHIGRDDTGTAAALVAILFEVRPFLTGQIAADVAELLKAPQARPCWLH